MSKYPCPTCLQYLIKNGFFDESTRGLTAKGMQELETTGFAGQVCYMMLEEFAIPNLTIDSGDEQDQRRAYGA